MDVHDIFLDRFDEMRGHREAAGVPFRVLAAEFAHFAGEALPVQVGVLPQQVHIPAVDDIAPQSDNFLQKLFVHALPVSLPSLQQRHDAALLSIMSSDSILDYVKI
ncbi:hypothetical protein D3C71_1912290 [compost metagenome]